MEPGVSSSLVPLNKDTDILTAEDDEQIKSLYDVPFVSVFQVGDEVHAEVFLTEDPDIDHDRLTTAQSVAEDLGYRCYARVFGDWGQVLMYFSDDPNKGIIWALESELGSAWSQ